MLRAYGTGLSWSPAYEETRYYAEPTTRIRAEGAKGGNLVKRTPYPIFLPHAVAAVLTSYAHFSGAERLKRRGAADVSRQEHAEAVLRASHVRRTSTEGSLPLHCCPFS